MLPQEIEADMAADSKEPMAGVVSTELCVPSTALEVGDDTEKSAPEVGDSVEFAATGKVSRVEGGHIYIDVTTVNNQPIAAQKPPDDMEESRLEADVEKARMENFS